MTDPITRRIRLITGRLLVASVVAGFRRPSHALAWGMERLGWISELRGANASAAAALMGILEAIDDDESTRPPDVSKQVAFLNIRPWFQMDDEKDPDTGVN